MDAHDRQRFRRYRSLAFICVLALLFTACGEVDFASQYRADGSATHTLTVSVVRVGLEEDQQRLAEAGVATAQQRANANGFRAERTDDGLTIGLRITNSTRNGADADLALNSIINALQPVGNPPLAPFQGKFSSVVGAVGGQEYTLEQTVDGLQLKTAMDEFLASINVAEVTTPRIEYAVIMPGTVRSSTGDQFDDNSVVWNLPLDAETDINVRSNVGNPTPWLLTLAVVIGALLLVLFSAFIVWKLLMARRGLGVARESVFEQEELERLRGEGNGMPSLTEPPRSFADARRMLTVLARRALRGETLDTRLARRIRQLRRPRRPRDGADT